MGGSSSDTGPTVPNGSGPDDPTWAFPSRGQHSQPRTDPPPPAREDWLPRTDAAGQEPARGYQPTQNAPWHPPTEMAGHPATEAALRQPPPGQRSPSGQAPFGQAPSGQEPSGEPPGSSVVRYGPGVPETAAASQQGTTAERIWKTGAPPVAARRRPPWRRALGPAVTVLLLGASAVVLFLRFHHPAFSVSGAAITQQTPVQCGANVTGRIDTNGSAGTISYQWLFQPDPHAPQPLTQTVPAGQHSVFVTVAVQGSGSGSATQKVTLQVLGPQKASAATTVTVRC
jgi:hypothetical protein